MMSPLRFMTLRQDEDGGLPGANVQKRAAYAVAAFLQVLGRWLMPAEARVGVNDPL